MINDGGKVAILDFAEERGKKVAAELGDSVIFCKTDVADEKNVQNAINKTVDTFGAIHFAINCAGVSPPMKVIGKDGPMPIDKFNWVLQVNLVGTMNVIRLAAEQMLKNKPNEDGEKGVVINTASAAAFEGQFGQAAYSASKAGVVGMTLPNAREFAKYGIRIVTIAPGIFETPLLSVLSDTVKEALIKTIPFPKRMGKPSEYAKLATHIIENAQMNGTTIRLDASIRL